MIIIIDGYNLLHAMYKDNSPDKLVALLQKYAKTAVHRIIVVFDAGPYYYPSAEKKENITIQFSGQMQSADDYINTYLSDHRNQDILLVTTDKEIIETAKRFSISWISSQDFADIIYIRIKNNKIDTPVIKTEIIKLSSERDNDLDLLMKESSEHIPMYDNNGEKEVLMCEKKRWKKDKKLWRKIKKL